MRYDWIEKARKHLEKLKGGLADGKDPSDFDDDDLEEGKKVEREHAKDEGIAREIAMDHITEDPKYYKKLKRIEKAKNWISKVLPKGVIRSKSPGSTVDGIHNDLRIGRTSSGKSIFSNSNNTAHSNFSSADHREAYVAHAQIISRSSHPDTIAHHKQALNHHFKMMNSDVRKAKKRSEHKGWTKEQHAKAMHLHHKKLMQHVNKLHKHMQSKKKGAMHHATRKALSKMIQSHAKEVHYHHTHSQGE